MLTPNSPASLGSAPPKQRRINLKRLLVLSSCCGLLGQAAFGQPWPGLLDEEALLPLNSKRVGPTRNVDPRRFSQLEVQLGERDSRTLAEIVPALTANQRNFESQLKRAAPGVLFEKPQISEEVLESADSFVLVRRTHLEVARPQELARISEDYANFLGHPDSGPVELEGPAQKEFEHYRTSQIPKLPANHPLRLAAARGPQALLQAILSGQGDFEVTDTYLIPRKNLSMQQGKLVHPTFREGSFDQNRGQPFRNSLFLPALGGDEMQLVPLPDQPALAIPPGPQPWERQSGANFAHINFLTGFSRGGSWEWERRWDYPSGFFRMSLGMSYGLGLRVPLRIQAETSPTQIEIRDRQDRPVNVVTKVSAHTFDAPGDFYRRMGLADRLLFDGQEAVLESQFYYGYKLRALWTDVLHQRRRDLGFDYSQNMAPPFADANPSLRLAIPPELTHTSIQAGPLKGYAQAALRLDGKGSIAVSHESLWNGQASQRQRLTFRERTAQTLVTQLPALVAELGQQVQARYGFRFFDPVYRLDLTLTPEVRLGLQANFKVWSRNFNTNWMALQGLRVGLGEVDLNRHSGTPNEFRYQGGVKSFLALLRSSSTPALDLPPQGSRLALVSQANGNYVRAGLGTDCHLGASARQIRGWETFQLERLGEDRVALRNVQNGRWVRAGVGRANLLAASSERVDRWETFHLVTLGQGRYALRSSHNQLYVGVAADGNLQASSTTLEGAQTFRLVRL